MVTMALPRTDPVPENIRYKLGTVLWVTLLAMLWLCAVAIGWVNLARELDEANDGCE